MSIDTTGSLTPIDLDTPLMVSPSGGDPTPLPQTRAADGTRQLKALPPPIPARAQTADLIAQPRTQAAELTAGVDAPALAGGTKTKLRAAPRATLPPPIPTAGRTSESVATESGPAIARTKMPVPPPNRAKGTVPPIRPLTADPDGWSVSAADSDTPLPPPAPGDDGLRDILSTDDDGPDSTRPTPFVEPAVTAPIAAEPSKEWLAKIDQVMRPETNPPVLFTTNAALPTTKAATEMFAAKAEAPSMTQPLELVDLDEVPGAAQASVVVTPSIAAPVVQQAAAPVVEPSVVEQPAAAPVWKPLPSTRPLPAPRTLPPPSAPAAVAASIGAAPALPRPRPSSPAMAMPIVPAAPAARMTGTGSAPVVDAAPAFEQSFDIEFDSPDMTSAHTTNFEMPATQSFISKRMKLALVGGVAVMLVAYLATRGGHKTTTAKPAPTAQTEAPAAAAPAATPAVAQAAAPAAVTPAAAPATTEPAAPAPAVQNIAAPAAPAQEVAAAPAPAAGMVRMPVTSKPSGALVTFVDGGKAVVVGRTPTTIELDPRQPHDIALTLLDHETQLVTIPTGGMTALVVDMGAAKTGAAVPSVPHVATEVATRTETPAPKHHAAAPAPKAAPVQHVAQPAPRMEETAPSGAGMLMISSKPPCEIVVDGKSTHLMTPQKAIPLAAGNHTIVLVNAGAHVHKTLGVIIQSKKSTKVIQDFTKH